MILTDKEAQQLQQFIEAQAKFDDELMRRCEHLVHIGAFDEAVRSAFVLLEERLRDLVGREGMTGTRLANYAFKDGGPLAKHLAHTPSEQEGLRELYSGAFKLFRNPTAHGMVGYDAGDGKAIIGLVNLLLRMLKRVEELPPPGIFPDNLESALHRIEATLGPGVVGRLRVFLGRCVQYGLRVGTDAKQWIPFRQYGLLNRDNWDAPRSHLVAVFYLVTASKKNPRLSFPTSYYYSHVEGFNLDRLLEELQGMGFQLIGKNQEPGINLQRCGDTDFFEDLFEVVKWTVDELASTLQG